MTKLLPLGRSFYEPSAEIFAPLLLGHWLVRVTPEGLCGGPIVETEAYLCDDPACHGAPGLTQRKRIMFGPPGFAHVYFIYGAHYCVNAVCRPQGIAEAVLIRAVEVSLGEPQMRRRRASSSASHLTNGPAKLCEAMQIDRKLDGADLCDPQSALFIAKNEDLERFRNQRGPLVVTTRIGITRAAASPLRFYLEGSNFISRRAKVPRSMNTA